jgi:hypothetical protein
MQKYTIVFVVILAACSGAWAAFNATISASWEAPTQRIEWEYAQVIARESPLVDAFSAALGLTDAQLDALFVQASKI